MRILVVEDDRHRPDTEEYSLLEFLAHHPDRPMTRPLIRTVRGVGYKLTDHRP